MSNSGQYQLRPPYKYLICFAQLICLYGNHLFLCLLRTSFPVEKWDHIVGACQSSITHRAIPEGYTCIISCYWNVWSYNHCVAPMQEGENSRLCRASAFTYIRHCWPFLLFHPPCSSTAICCPRLPQGIWCVPWETVVSHLSQWGSTEVFCISQWPAIDAQFWTVLRVVVIILLMAWPSKFLNSLLTTNVHRSGNSTHLWGQASRGRFHVMRISSNIFSR